jgi:tetraacyldisaccharide 4'-kinase
MPFLHWTERLYALGLRRDQERARERGRKLPAFVVSLGNLTIGGTGKTPIALWLAKHLNEEGWKAAILSRGYGRKKDSVSPVPSEGPTLSLVERFGDEPVLMARKMPATPVWVGRDRFRSGEAAIQERQAQILILDDGFQHLSLKRNLDLLLLDAHDPFGNGALIPLGPLREPIASISRADAVLLTRADDPERSWRTRRYLKEKFPGKAIYSCRHRLAGLRQGLAGPVLSREYFQNKPAVAFAGIARPEAFFGSLQRWGVRLSRCLGFPDHAPFGNAERALLMTAVREANAHFLITTEKDYVRLPAELQSIVVTAELAVDFGEEEDAFLQFLEAKIAVERLGMPL